MRADLRFLRRRGGQAAYKKLCGKTGLFGAPIGQNMPHFGVVAMVPRGAKGWFSRRVSRFGAESDARCARRYK
jgi:hypothetical protein